MANDGGAFTKFEGIALLTPRGFFTVEFHVSFVHLRGQSTNLKIQYTTVKRIYMLPESHQRTIVFLKLDPPIQDAQTLYPHIVMQFESQQMVHNIPATRKLSGATYTGPIHEVFARILQGCSRARIIRPGDFRNCQGGLAVKSYSKDECGLLYPLQRSFFFLLEQPIHILDNEIYYVDFEKHDDAGEYFNLLIKLDSEVEHIFQNIHINEYQPLYDFLRCKGMIIRKPQSKDGIAAVSHLKCIESDAIASGDESDEEEEPYFSIDKNDGGSQTDDSGGEDSDDSGKKSAEEDLDLSEASSSGKKFLDGGSTITKEKTKKDRSALKRTKIDSSWFSEYCYSEEEEDYFADPHRGCIDNEISSTATATPVESSVIGPRSTYGDDSDEEDSDFVIDEDSDGDDEDEDGSNMTSQKKHPMRLKRKRAGSWIFPPHSGSKDYYLFVEKDDGSTDDSDSDSGGEDEDSDASGGTIDDLIYNLTCEL